MNMLGSWPMGFGIFGFFGTVSMNMFIHRSMGFVIFVFLGLSRRICSFRVVGPFREIC